MTDGALIVVLVATIILGVLLLAGVLYMMYVFGIHDIERHKAAAQKMKMREAKRLTLIRQYDKQRIADASSSLFDR